MNVPRQNLTEQEWLEIRIFSALLWSVSSNAKMCISRAYFFENSPRRNLHPLMCENVILDGLFCPKSGLFTEWRWTGSGSCRNSIIVNCTFDVGDDGICIKSGKDRPGRRSVHPSTENVIVDNCKVFQGHGGFVVGSEMSGGAQYLSEKLPVSGHRCRSSLQSTRGRGGVVENNLHFRYLHV